MKKKHKLKLGVNIQFRREVGEGLWILENKKGYTGYIY